MTRHKTVEQARKLASMLSDRDACELAQCSRQEHRQAAGEEAGESCLGAEDSRPLTRREKASGWVRRPFYAFDADGMCPGCAAYWHAERAAQILEQRDATLTRREAMAALNARDGGRRT